jgi:hypothetical protein
MSLGFLFKVYHCTQMLVLLPHCSWPSHIKELNSRPRWVAAGPQCRALWGLLPPTPDCGLGPFPVPLPSPSPPLIPSPWLFLFFPFSASPPRLHLLEPQMS